MLSSNIVKSKTFLHMCEVLSGLSTCPRGNVGVIIVDKYGKSVSFGYNGAPSGMNHCEDGGCILTEGHCSSAVHAEINAILNGDSSRMREGIMYIFGYSPCYRCSQAIITVGIHTIIMSKQQREMSTDQKRGWEMLGQAGVFIEVDSV